MLRFILILFVFLIGNSIFAQKDTTNYSPNFAVAYCHYLGYKIEIQKDQSGNEFAICIFPDGNTADIFSFFKGEVGEKWSYGCRLGYHVEPKSISNDDVNFTFANCKKYDQDKKLIEEISQIELLIRNKVPNFEDINIDAFLKYISIQ